MTTNKLKLGIFILILIGLSIFLTGCMREEISTPEIKDNDVSKETTVPSEEIKTSEVPVSDKDSETEEKKDIINEDKEEIVKKQKPEVTFSGEVVKANNEFAFDLYEDLKSEEGNIFFSPYSISSALSMVYEGAKGNTAKEMKDVLHLPADIVTVRSDFLSINSELNKENKPYALSAANALWAQESYPFNKEYFDVIETYYDGKTTNLDFATKTEDARITINDWVEEKTNDKIQDIISEGSLSSDTRLVLTNAVYFKGNWSDQFLSEDTWDGPFYVTADEPIWTDMMHKESDFNYGENSLLKLLEMDYLGEDLSMLIILPKGNNLGTVERELNADKLEEFKKGMKTEKVEVTLPKFKFEADYALGDRLKDMGMSLAFSSMADLTGISETAKLFLSQVFHKTFIEVAEYGTEAAAATVAMVQETGMPLEKPLIKKFVADHPFIFLIQEKESGNILFMGRMNNPSQN